MMKRRDFLKSGPIAAAAAVASGTCLASDASREDISKYAPTSLSPEFKVNSSGELEANPDQRMAFSMCFGCYSTCAVRARIDNASDQVVRVAGNPYGAAALTTPMDLATPPREAFQKLSAVADQGLANRATLCGRGNSVVDAFNDPHRMTQCLKRVGKRGEDKWQTISYEQLLEEVTEGGDLFGEGPVEGLKQIHRNKALANPDFPDFGPSRNQLLGTACKNQYARKQFFDRFLFKSWGTPNHGVKSAYCGVSSGSMGITSASAIDINHCEFAIFIGSNPGLVSDNANISARRMGNALTSRKNFKYVVIDPILRASTPAASHENSEWLPVRTGSDTALMFAMLQYIINQARYNADFLSIANQKAAEKFGEVNHSNATYLVVREKDHPLYNQFLTASAMGLGDENTQVVIDKANGLPVASSTMKKAKLFFNGQLTLTDGSSVTVETALSLLKKRVNEKTMDDYANHCQIPVAKIEALAKEFTSHGRKAGIVNYTGISVPDSIQFEMALTTLNAMNGSSNARGGTSYHNGSTMSGKYNITAAPLYDLMAFEHTRIEGFSAERFGNYEESHEYQEKVRKGLPPYPANNPWLVNDKPLHNSGSHLIAHANKDPYQFKAWINWSSNPIYGCPGLANQVEESIKDPGQLGLIIAVDAYLNETNQYADYFVPDLVQYEQWSMARMGSSLVVGESACAPIVEPRTVKNQHNQPVCMEQFVIDIAKRLDLNGFGENAFKDVQGNPCALHTPEDFYVRLYANLAHSGKPLPTPTADDLKLTSVDRLTTQFSERLKPEELGPTLFMLTRGGRYEPLENLYEGEFFHKSLRKPFQHQIYNEKMARRKDSYTGQYFEGLPVFDVHRFWDGTPVREFWSEQDYPYYLSTFKSHMRSPYSVALPRITALGEENFIQMHRDDAARQSLKTGDKARLTFPNGESIEGIIQADKGTARNTVSIAHGYGHTAFGARDIFIDDERRPGLKSRAGGISTNAISAGDPTCKGASLMRESRSGAAIRHSIPLRVEKV